MLNTSLHPTAAMPRLSLCLRKAARSSDADHTCRMLVATSRRPGVLLEEEEEAEADDDAPAAAAPAPTLDSAEAASR
jgi:hypothetical protein